VVVLEESMVLQAMAQMVDAVVVVVATVPVRVVLDRSAEMAEVVSTQVVIHTVLSAAVEEVWEAMEELLAVPVEDRVEQDKRFRWEEPHIW
jgi:hypothetical protein